MKRSGIVRKCLGEIPTPEEWLKYVVEFLTAEGREDLWRWSPGV